MQGKCVTKENNSYGPKFPSTITFLMVCPLRISLTYAHYVIHDWKKQIPNLDFWCRWSTDLCVKQIDIYVILRALSQNCKCVSIGVVRSIGEYGFLSGLVSGRGGVRDSESHLLWPPLFLTACLPCVARPRSQSFSSSSKLHQLIQMDLWEAEYNRLLYKFFVFSFCVNNCFVPL